MPKKRYKSEEIVAKLRQVDGHLSQGNSVADAIRQIGVSLIPKSAAHTYGLERFWNNHQRRSEKGLEVSPLAWLDITDNCACGLSVEQTPPSDKSDEITPGRRRTAAYGRQRILDCNEHDWRATRALRDGIDALTLKQDSG